MIVLIGEKMKSLTFIFIVLIEFGSASDNYYYKNNQKISLVPHNVTLRNSSNIDYYKNEKGILLGITDKIIIKVTDESYLRQYTQEFNLTIEKKLSTNLYLVKVSEKNKTLNIANSLNQKEGITYAHPDFIKKRILR